MILSKSAIQAATLVAIEDKPDIVYFSEGALYAVNRKAALLLSPLIEEYRHSVPLTDSGPVSIGVRCSALKAILRLIPADKLFKGLLESTDVRVKDRAATWTVTDGRRTHETRCAVELYDVALIDNLRKTWNEKWNDSKPSALSALNAKRVMVLLNAIRIAGGFPSGEEPVWWRVCSDGSVLLRAVNLATHQRVLGMCSAYQAEEGQMPPWLEWERYTNKRRPMLRKRS